MKILIACEYSGIVRRAFAAKGHKVWSCDLLPSEDNSPRHHQGDVLEFIAQNHFDMMVAHPPCTFLAVSGLHWNNRVEGRSEKTEKALEFVQKIMNAPIAKIVVENPVSCISSRIRKPDQIIQPWMFGEDASKATCLWLKGLQKLKPTSIFPPKGYGAVKFATDMHKCLFCEDVICPDCDEHFSDCPCIGPTEDGVTYKTICRHLFGTRINPAPRPIWSNQTPSGQNKLGPSPNRWKERARTYQGIADAFANQWG